LLLKAVVPRATRESAVAPALSLLSPFAVRLRSAAPLAFTRPKGCAVQRDNTAHAKDQPGQDTDQREKKAGMCLAIQPLAANESESDRDR
jgi:hypothetical protein